MGLMRSALLAGSQSGWLRLHATRYPFVRRSVSRFMPGERLQDALEAARQLQARGASSILTCLGENVDDPGQAAAVARHYLEVLDRIADARLPAQVSVKLTQLGLDLGDGRHLDHLLALLARADATGGFVWIDMESSRYVDATLEAFRAARRASARVGVALQSYLRRTPADLESLLAPASAVRLVKGAYREPAAVAFPRKREVDEAYFALAARFLEAAAERPGGLLGIATHDPRLVARLRTLIAERAVPAAAYEFEMLYGIQRGLQAQLLEAGHALRVLVSYGEHWFPWYMRRLAERPANVWFLLRSLLSG
jgi:proline dehydrogenase